ncbi:MAG: TRAP transporter substrate-binding protein DctP [Spirochaetales bacterium]|nr:TRAP transporter substrate-binding protein DctP [Spirochaetales bacterium]
MNTRRLRAIVALTLLILLLPAVDLTAQVIKLASVAPDGSPWDKALKRLAVDWREISGGRVTLKIYGGGVAGDEPDMIRKMRINQIQGAAMSGSGLGKIDPDWLVFQLPFMATTDDELDYLFEKLRPELEERMEAKGFTFLALTHNGWLRFFSKEKIIEPADMRRMKFFVLEGSPEIDQAWKEMGFHIVPLPANDAFAALQSGMVDVFSASPLTGAAFQWFALAPNMTDFHWTPLTAGMVVSNRAWQRIPAALRPQLKAATERVLKDMEEEVMAVEEQAVEIMEENGLVIHHVPPEALEKWNELVETGFSILIGDVISRDLYEQAKAILAEYRSR